MKRREFIAATLAVGIGTRLGFGDAKGAENPKVLRIGFQKNGVILVAKQQNLIEKLLEPEGITVSWHEFKVGPPLLEALNTGAIDFGTTGDAPPIFAQAARANLYYVAAHGGAQNAIIVP